MAERKEAGQGTGDPPARRGPSMAQVRARAAGLAAGVIRWGGLLIAAVLVVHIILVIGDANPGNGITIAVGNWADVLALGFKNLFTPGNAKLRVMVNDGVAAIFWLAATEVAARLLRRSA
ncbi:MAG TPA: hypothetical protein VKV80_08450 [Streptosporangiaceae bacterium]|nr:hypothetical protein [Streptosporangiaceae bacterium]